MSERISVYRCFIGGDTYAPADVAREARRALRVVKALQNARRIVEVRVTGEAFEFLAVIPTTTKALKKIAEAKAAP